MFNVWLAGDHLYGKCQFTWLSLVMSLMMSYFVLSFFPRDVFDEIWDLIESVIVNFPTYLYTHKMLNNFLNTDKSGISVFSSV